MERHYTVHDNPARHTNPHDHDIKWVTPDGHPEPQAPINYPDRAPEFKSYEGKDKNCEAFKPETEKCCDTADGVLEYIVGGDHQRDMITQVTVFDRTI